MRNPAVAVTVPPARLTLAGYPHFPATRHPFRDSFSDTGVNQTKSPAGWAGALAPSEGPREDGPGERGRTDRASAGGGTMPAREDQRRPDRDQARGRDGGYHGPFGSKKVLIFGSPAGTVTVSCHGGAAADDHRPWLGGRARTGGRPDRRHGRLPAGRGRRRAPLPARGRERAAGVQAAIRRRAGADRRAGPLPHAG